jgi:hypothetical protein
VGEGATTWHQLRGAADALAEAATLAPRATGGNGGRRPYGSMRGNGMAGTDHGVMVPAAERAWVGGDNGERRTAVTMAGTVVSHGLDRDSRAIVQVVWSFGN